LQETVSQTVLQGGFWRKMIHKPGLRVGQTSRKTRRRITRKSHVDDRPWAAFRFPPDIWLSFDIIILHTITVMINPAGAVKTAGRGMRKHHRFYP
jgi:hypothetical protein